MSRPFAAAMAALLTLAVVVLAVTLVLDMLPLVETPPLRYPDLPEPVITAAVPAGTAPGVLVSTCGADAWAPAPLAYHSNAFLVSEDNRVSEQALPEFTGGVPAAGACRSYTSWRLVVPQDTAPGTYHFAGQVTVSGRYRLFEVDWTTASFEVVADGEGT